jgi:hypothetical protein
MIHRYQGVMQDESLSPRVTKAFGSAREFLETLDHRLESAAATVSDVGKINSKAFVGEDDVFMFEIGNYFFQRYFSYLIKYKNQLWRTWIKLLLM